MASKKRKIEDEHRGFQAEWTDAFACVPDKKAFPVCLLCNENLSSNKKYNVERHFNSKHSVFAEKYPVGEARQRAIQELQRRSALSTNAFSAWMNTSKDTAVATFVAAAEIAKKGKPFTDAEFIKETFLKISEELFVNFKNKNEILKKIKDMPLSAKTVKSRVVKMAENISDLQVNDINSTTMFSIACDESCDIDDTAQLAVYCRYINLDAPQEELFALLPLCGQTRGEDIESAVINFLKSKNIDLNKIVSVATDGCPSMIAHEKGFAARLKKHVDHDLISFHCILHQEALCAQTLPNDLTKVMNLVVKIVNKIRAHALNHRQFCHLLEELDHQYSDLLIHNKVRWLSRGKVLSRFASCLEEVKLFLFEKGIEYSELTDPEWLLKFFFMVDIFTHFNELNRKLQGKGTAAIFLLEEVVAFERKLMLFKKDMDTTKLIHFPTLKRQAEEMSLDIDFKVFSEIIAQIAHNFSLRFDDFRKEKDTLKFIINPLEIDTDAMSYSPFFGVNIAEFELQLEDLKAKDIWKNKFKELGKDLENLERERSKLASMHKWTEINDLPQQDAILFRAWNGLPECYGQLKNVAFGILSIFGSTYLCEQLFSHMSYGKNKYRNKMANDTLEYCLKIKTSGYSPNIKQLAESLQQQKSH